VNLVRRQSGGTVKIDLRHIQTTLPGCVAAGVVDLETGALLDAAAVSDGGLGRLQRACAAARGLLDGADARASASVLERRAGVARAEGAFQQVVIRAGDVVCSVQRSRAEPTRALLTICADVINLGRVIAESRALVDAA
jgi:hypothetical protein